MKIIAGRRDSGSFPGAMAAINGHNRVVWLLGYFEWREKAE
ncbi:hypothetical protein [Hyphococcus lacteus]|uniref:Uncharacterized protein n=1 Tax=Hyphococcus lacteus TaxID=3143536 RepID=A0ABV3Z5Z1_9PROT